MSFTSQVLPNGTYNVISVRGGQCLTLTNNQPPLQIWDCNVDSQQQQWVFQALSNVTYTVKNVASNTYISTTTPNQNTSVLLQSSVSYPWYITSKSPFSFSPNSSFTFQWSIPTTGNGTAVELLCTCSGDLSPDWLVINALQSTGSNSQFITPSKTDRVWKIVGPVFAGLFALLLLALVWVVWRWRHQSETLEAKGDK